MTINYEDEKGIDSAIFVDPTTSKVSDRFGSKCASFDLESYGIKRITTVRIEGSNINVFAHEQDKFPIAELSSKFEPITSHEVTISASKIIDKEKDMVPCFKGEEEETIYCLLDR